MFFRRDVVLDFDENLGVGALYGSCEDADFLYRIINSGAVGIYTPAIEVWHPEPDFSNISLSKVENYAAGFGYFIMKDMDVIKCFLFILLVFKKTVQLLMNMFTNNFQSGYFKAFFSGLIKGIKGHE